MHLVREAYSLSTIIIAIPADGAGIVFFREHPTPSASVEDANLPLLLGLQPLCAIVDDEERSAVHI